MHRRFYLYRPSDVPRLHTGRIGEGVLWSDGTVTVRWCMPGEPCTTVSWPDVATFRDRVANPGRITIIMEDDKPFDGEEVVDDAVNRPVP